MERQKAFENEETKDNKSSEGGEKTSVVKADPTRKRVVGGRKRAGNRIPDDILNNQDLIADMAILPQNYNFEVSSYFNILKTKIMVCNNISEGSHFNRYIFSLFCLDTKNNMAYQICRIQKSRIANARRLDTIRNFYR